MKLFNLDLHISVIEDIKNILTNLGHELISKSISSHNWVFNREPSKMDIITETTWTQIDQKMCDDFYKRYKHELINFDGFVVTHTPVFSLLYEKFDKPIYTVASTRYESPFSNDQNKWDWLNKKLISMIDSGQVIPLANNLYDKYYCEYFTNRTWQHIPNICDYTKSVYSPKHKRFFLFKNKYNRHVISARIDDSNLYLNSVKNCINKSSLGKHKWSDLYSYKSIIHLPYNLSIMSIFEQYSANVPLFFPTADFLNKNKKIVSEILFENSCISDVDKNKLINHETISLADFYDEKWMPYIIHFEDSEHLNNLLFSTNFEDVSNEMKKFNVIRKEKIHSLWENILNENRVT